ncbi:MAG TPA: hypothetical protein VGO04_31420 [Ensifer sp.]|jgi:hypothetical protein|uniref:hypothetical protein n=1 Tax=Ensifer sp. TaxID=1872086 RepID=UPI002E1160B9|nr:hypothetical protein [Ensifer sp.]
MANNDDEDASHLFGWLCATLILAGVVVFALWSGPGRDLMCLPEETKCAREWLAALSGWAAVAAALPTVWFINRQIRDTNRHHAESIALQLLPTLALTHRIAEHAHQTRTLVSNMVANLVPEWQADEDLARQMYRALHHLQQLQERMAARDYDDFEEKIGSNLPGQLHSAREDIRKLKAFVFDSATGKEDSIDRLKQRRDKLAHCATRCQDYSTECADRAEAFLQRWSAASG